MLVEGQCGTTPLITTSILRITRLWDRADLRSDLPGALDSIGPLMRIPA